MINVDNAYEVVRRALELRKKEGNVGRSMRRFIRQVCDGMTDLFVEFAPVLLGSTPRSLDASRFAQCCLYADAQTKSVALWLDGELTGTRLHTKGVVADYDFQILSVRYVIDVDIDTCSVEKLREVLQGIAIVADGFGCALYYRDAGMRKMCVEKYPLLLDERMTDVLERLASRQQANPETPLEKKVVSLVSKYFHEPLSPLELKVLFPAFKVAEFA